MWRIIQDAVTIKGLQAMLAEKDKSINELLRLANEKSQNEIQLTSQLEQCEASIEDMNTIINQHEATIEAKDDLIHHYEITIDEFQNTMVCNFCQQTIKKADYTEHFKVCPKVQRVK